MTTIVEQIRSMSPETQWEIISEIMDTLSPTVDEGIFKKRSDEIKSGKVKAVSHEEMMARLEARIKR